MRYQLTSISDLKERGDLALRFIVNTDESEEYYVPRSICDELDAEHPSQELRTQFVDSRTVQTPARSIAYLKNCFVLPNAAIVTPSGNIIAESCLPYTPPWISDMFGPWIRGSENDYTVILPDADELKQPCIYLREHGEMGFFHWMHSVLRRLDILKQHKFSSDFGLLCQAETAFQVSGLELAGAADLPRIAPSAQHPQFFRDLIFPSPLVKDGDFWLRPLSVNRFFSGLFLASPTSITKNRLYITRQDALVRRLQNERRLMDELSNIGFASVNLSEMTLYEQISLFRQAEVVVGCHGAGLSHVVSMNAGAKLLEIVHPRRFWPTYRAIAARQGVQYGFVLGEDQIEQSGDSFDFEVNLVKTMNVLKSLGID